MLERHAAGHEVRVGLQDYARRAVFASTVTLELRYTTYDLVHKKIVKQICFRIYLLFQMYKQNLCAR